MIEFDCEVVEGSGSAALGPAKPCDSRLIPPVTANQEFAITDDCGNRNVKKTAQYFVPRLVTPIYGCIGIGVVRVVERIVVPSDRPHFSPLFEKAWL